MTVAAFLGIAGAVVAVFGGVFAFVANRLVFHRLDALEASRIAMGERFGEGLKGIGAELSEIKGHLREWSAVERYKQGRWP